MLVYSYLSFSNGANDLAKLLNAKVVTTLNDENYNGETVINWGSGRIPKIKITKWINNPKYIMTVSNKITALSRFKKFNLSHIPYTTSKAVAQKWHDDGHIVFARTKYGYSGKGIKIVNLTDDLPNAQLYTRYIPKDREFRIHVIKNKVVVVVEKIKGNDSAHPLISSFKKGWIFKRDNIIEPVGLRSLAIKAVKCLNLDFGAVDIIYTSNNDKCYLLEVNTSPGLIEPTTSIYAECFKNLF